jgi:RNA polymerase sigma-70 factor (ECF subfamily)
VVGPNLLEDALQESYLVVFSKIDQVREPAAFKSWSCRIVLHICYQLKSRHPAFEELPDIGAQASESDQIVASVALRQGLARLNRNDRDILILREMLNLSYEEIAETLKLSGGTVRSRLHKARHRLAQRLDPESSSPAKLAAAH